MDANKKQYRIDFLRENIHLGLDYCVSKLGINKSSVSKFAKKNGIKANKSGSPKGTKYRNNKKKWTIEKIQFIRDNAHLGCTALANHFNTNREVIFSQAALNGISFLDARIRIAQAQPDFSIKPKKIKERPIVLNCKTDEVVKKIKDNAHLGAIELSKMLNIPIGTVKSKAFRKGISLKQNK